MNWQDVLFELSRANLPTDRFVIVGGAAMAARGLRDTEDVDLVVTPSLFEELEQAGWRRKQRPNGRPGLRWRSLEAYLDVNCGRFERTTQWLLQHADVIDGIPIVDLETLARFKASYGRAKDDRDLELICVHIGTE